MSIVWGSYEGTSKERVGIDITQSPSTVTSSTTSVTLTIKYYVHSLYNISDNQVLNLSGAIDDTYSYNLSGTDVTELIATKTLTVSTSYSGSVSKSFSAEVSGHYGGATPGLTRSWTVAARPADTPNAPPWVSGTPTSVTATSAHLDWDGAVNNGSAITSYQLQVSTNSGFTSTVYNNTNAGGSATVSGLTRATTYYARVRAVNGVGAGDWSTTKSFTTDTTAPKAPGTPTNSLVTSNSARSTWTAPTDNGGSAITGYDVQISTTSGFTTGTFSQFSTTSLFYDFTGLFSAKQYWVRVRAKNAPNGAGAWSTTTTFTTLAGAFVKKAGVWKGCRIWVRKSGVWKSVIKVWVNKAGTWKTQ